MYCVCRCRLGAYCKLDNFSMLSCCDYAFLSWLYACRSQQEVRIIIIIFESSFGLSGGILSCLSIFLWFSNLLIIQHTSVGVKVEKAEAEAENIENREKYVEIEHGSELSLGLHLTTFYTFSWGLSRLSPSHSNFNSLIISSSQKKKKKKDSEKTISFDLFDCHSTLLCVMCHAMLPGSIRTMFSGV